MHFSSTIDRHCRSTNKMIHTQWGSLKPGYPKTSWMQIIMCATSFCIYLLQCYPSSSDIITLFKQRHLCPPKKYRHKHESFTTILRLGCDFANFFGSCPGHPSQLTVGSHPSSGSAWLPGRHQSNSPR